MGKRRAVLIDAVVVHHPYLYASIREMYVRRRTYAICFVVTRRPM